MTVRNVWLVGMPGSGKSSVGRSLAPLLGAAFVDADAEVEARAGRSVADVFEAMGEAAFRRFECEVVADLAGRTGLVVATGGGAVLDPANVDAMRSSGTVVLLRLPVAMLVSRVAAGAPRPLVRGPDDLHRLAEEREDAYAAAADVAVDARGGARRVARRILEALS